MSESGATRAVAVIVAYNRRELLAEAIQALHDQSRPLDGLVVVDNASTDGSSELVAQLAPEAHLVSLARNTGGAGGFAVGIQQAIERFDPTWLWIMDDDTIPTPDALSALLTAVDGTDFVLAGSRVVWHDGRDHPMNTPRQRPGASRARRRAAAAAGGIAVRSSSFVSMFVRADEVRRVGLPVVDYFIWNDDFEYSTRILRAREGLHVPASVVVHKTARFGAADLDPGERFAFEVRNKLWMFRTSTSLSPGEKLLYGAATLRRWMRTAIRSSDRATLRAAFARGWVEGWRERPRANAIALGDLGEIAQGVAALENAARAGAGVDRG